MSSSPQNFWIKYFGSIASFAKQTSFFLDHFVTILSFYLQTFFTIVENVTDPWNDFWIDKVKYLLLDSVQK